MDVNLCYGSQLIETDPGFGDKKTQRFRSTKIPVFLSKIAMYLS
jgi:hypothetical protein